MEVFNTAFNVLIYSAFLAFVVMCFWMLVEWSWSLAGLYDKVFFFGAFTAFAIVQVFILAKDSIVV